LDDSWIFLAAQSNIQENFNAEMGFFPRTDIRRTDLYASYAPRPGILSIRQIYFFNDFNYLSSQDGQLQTRLNYPGFWALFNNGSYLLFLYLLNYERLTEEFEIFDDVIIPVDVYRFENIYAEFQTDKSRFLSALFSWRSGGFYNGNLSSYGLKLNLKVGAHLTANLMMDYNNASLFLVTLIQQYSVCAWFILSIRVCSSNHLFSGTATAGRSAAICCLTLFTGRAAICLLFITSCWIYQV